MISIKSMNPLIQESRVKARLVKNLVYLKSFIMFYSKSRDSITETINF